MKKITFEQIPVWHLIPNNGDLNVTLACGVLGGFCKSSDVVAARLMKLTIAGAVELSPISEDTMEQLSVILHTNYLRYTPTSKENIDLPALLDAEIRLHEELVGPDPIDRELFEILQKAMADNDILTARALQDYYDHHTSKFVKIGDDSLDAGYSALENSGAVEKKFLGGKKMSDQGYQLLEQTAGYYKYLIQEEKAEPDTNPWESSPYAVLFRAVPEHTASLKQGSGRNKTEKLIQEAYYWGAWSCRLRNWILMTRAAQLDSDNVTAGHMWTRACWQPWGVKVSKWT